jgi:uncharacterized damage-inducible protein DinB
MVLTEKCLDVLLQLSTFVNRMPEGTYSRPLEILEGSSIGKHAQHIVTCFECLFASASTGVVEYDTTLRELRPETDPRELLGRIAAMALVLRTDDFDRTNELGLRTTFEDQTDGVLINTSFDRELWYTIEHCMHHLAMIRIAALQIGITDLPDDFGVTLSNRNYLFEHKD